jgi:deoxyribodipyrimidine photo-lyase
LNFLLPLTASPIDVADFAAITRLGIPSSLHTFDPSHAAAVERLGSVHPAEYARSRNALDGAVTGLSPYFTHGLLRMDEAARSIHQRHQLSFDDKLVFEFAWREFFHHVWSRADNHGDAILQDMHGELPWHGQYADVLPPDIREGRTGVAAIDNAVRILYATGYLHNHLRMWLASYVVHVRKVHWRAGADWLYGHLLDGDLASNHLSWQWVAATFSSKPYLFNAENVSKYAPGSARAAWDCRGTAIDQSYEALDAMARNQAGRAAERGQHNAVSEPTLMSLPYEGFDAAGQSIRAQAAIDNIATDSGAALELIHPSSLAPRAAQPGSPASANVLRIGIIHTPAHAMWPWSERRWRFVLSAMAQTTDAIWVGDIARLELPQSVKVTAQATLFPGYRDALAKVATLADAPRLLPNPSMACRSFSKFYERARRDVGQFSDLL